MEQLVTLKWQIWWKVEEERSWHEESIKWQISWKIEEEWRWWEEQLWGRTNEEPKNREVAIESVLKPKPKTKNREVSIESVLKPKPKPKPELKLESIKEFEIRRNLKQALENQICNLVPNLILEMDTCQALE